MKMYGNINLAVLLYRTIAFDMTVCHWELIQRLTMLYQKPAHSLGVVDINTNTN